MSGGPYDVPASVCAFHAFVRDAKGCDTMRGG
jgi:hypothetical protein